MPILVVADVVDDALLPVTLSTVTAAREIARHTGTEVHMLLTGHRLDPAIPLAAALADRVLVASSEALADRNPESVAATVVALNPRGYSHFLFGSSNFGKSVAPRVAAALDVAQFSDVTAIRGDSVFQRPVYAGNVIATVEALDPIKVLTIRAAAFAPAPTSGATAAIETCPAIEHPRRSRVTERHADRSDRPDLTSAKVIVSGGRGLGSKENYDRILTPLADKLGAALGASRAAVDAGFAPNDRQVGQTGKIVAPEVYVAIGLSGAIQHLAGMRDSKLIVAVNSDPDAPIFGVADIGLVADLFTAVPQWLAAS